jgi:hypothetical protein
MTTANRALSCPHVGLFVGFGCLATSLCPILAFIVLQSLFGYFPGNNGLGLGLWLGITAVPAVIVLAAGALFDERRLKRSRSPSTPDHRGTC